MADAAAVELFWTPLERSNLLSAAQWQAARAEHGAETEPQSLADRLVAQGLLTRWQARMLLEGRDTFFLGRYRLLEPLGRGGMGAVFKAEQMPLGRVVALKIMAERFVTDPAYVARFRREIEAAAALSHPNIVTALDADSVADTHFLVMECVEGHDLGRIIRRQKRLPVSTACEYVRQAAEGLQHAHERGMVHRDIKPGNLLVSVEKRRATDSASQRPTDSGQRTTIKILDFGLSRFASEVGEDRRLTQSGQIMGTPDYIAPEQARDSRSTDIRGDIYSLGCTLYRLLAGRLPFDGANAIEQITARMTEDPIPLTSRRPEVPAELAAVVHKMLARRPQDRHQTPAEVAAALAPFANLALIEDTATILWTEGTDEPNDDGPSDGAFGSSAEAAGEVPSSPSPVALSDRSNWDAFLRNLDNEAAPQPNHAAGMLSETADPLAPTIIAGAERSRAARGGGTQTLITAQRQAERRRIVWMVFGLLVVAGLLGGFAWWQQAGRTTLIVEWPEDQRGDGRLEIDSRHVELASRGPLEFSGRSGRRQVALFRKDYEPIETAWTFARGERRVFRPQWTPKPDTVRRQQWERLQADVAALNADLSLRTHNDPVRSDESRQKVQELTRRIEAHREEWFETKGVVEAAANLVASLPAPADALRREDVPPEELTIAGHGDANHAASELVAVLGSGRLRHWSEITSVAFSPDGQLIASADQNAAIVWDARTGHIRRRLLAGPSPSIINCIAFSPDGRWLAMGTAGSGALTVADVATGRQVFSHPAHPGENSSSGLYDVAFSPDGSRIASCGYDSTVLLWEVSAGAGRIVQRLTGHSGSALSLAFSSDGQLVAAGGRDGALYVWDASTGDIVQTLQGSFLAFAPEGNLLASTADGNIAQKLWGGPAIKLWDARSGELLHAIEGHGRYSLSFSPDGQLLASVNYGVMELIDLSNRTVRTSIYGSGHRIAFSPDGKRIVIGRQDGSVSISDAMTRRNLIEQPPRLTSIAVSPDGQLLAIGDETGGVTLRDLATLEEVRRIDGHELFVSRLAFSPDGRLLASADGHDSGSAQEPVHVWEVSLGQQLSSVQLPHGSPGLAFSPDSSLMASVNLNPGPEGMGLMGHLKVWKARTGEIVHAANAPKGALRTVFSSDGRRLFVSGGFSDPPLQAWDVESWRERPRSSLEVPPRWQIHLLALSPDGRTLAGTGRGIKLWDALTCQLLRDPRGDVRSLATERAVDLSFAPDGTTLAVATQEGTVELWDLGKDRLRKTLQLGPAAGGVQQAIFTPDGRHLVMRNANGTVYVLRLRERPAGKGE